MKYNITVGVIGSGFMGKKHIAVLKDLVETVILCSADEEGGKALAEEYGCKFYNNYIEMFEAEKLDFVSVCLPTHLHYQAVMKAFEQGINVLCEKPFASSAEQAQEMVRVAKEKNLLLMVGHVVRFMKSYEYLKRCIKDERFGKMVSLELFRHGGMPSWSVGNWLADISRSGGALSDFHIHDTDMIINLLGSPKSVLTVGSMFASQTIYRYDEEIAVSASGSWRGAKSYPFTTGFEANFEVACIKYDIKNGLRLYTMDSETDPLTDEQFSEFYESKNAVKNEIKYFCHCLTNKLQPELCPSEESLKTIIVNCAEVESLKMQKEIEI